MEEQPSWHEENEHFLQYFNFQNHYFVDIHRCYVVLRLFNNFLKMCRGVPFSIETVFLHIARCTDTGKPTSNELTVCLCVDV